MTESRWLKGTDPLALLRALHPPHTLGSIEPQKRPSRMYLLACARQRHVWARMPPVCRALVELAEGCVDAPNKPPLPEEVALIAARLMGSTGAAVDLNDAAVELSEYLRSHGGARLAIAPPDAPPGKRGWQGLAALVYLPFETFTPNYELVPPVMHSVHLIHEVYGNPYRRVPFDPNWRTDTAVSLARDMYERREFSAMPILADALQDAGCNRADILDHCRAPCQAHARGCWVLDIILSKDR
jgi:hypothetical protein